jgi:hypothetical protein
MITELTNVVIQQIAGAGVGFCPWRRRSQWLRFHICHVFNVFKVRKCIQVFNRIDIRVDLTMASGFDASGCPANCLILPVYYWNVFRMV